MICIYTVAKDFETKYFILDDDQPFNIEVKLNQIAQKLSQKIVVLRDWIRGMSLDQLEKEYASSTLPKDIVDEIQKRKRQRASNIPPTLANQLNDLSQNSDILNINMNTGIKDQQQQPIIPAVVNPMMLVFVQKQQDYQQEQAERRKKLQEAEQKEREGNPSGQFDDLRYDSSSTNVARASIAGFNELIDRLENYMYHRVSDGTFDLATTHGRELFDYVESTLGDDVMSLIWCIDKFAALWYLSTIAKFLLGAPGQQTQAEKIFKYLKGWVGPERSSFTPSALENCFKVHRKLMEDSLNAQEEKYATKSEIACLLTMKMLGFEKHPELIKHYKKLHQTLTKKQKNHSNIAKISGMNLFFFF